MKDLTTWEVRKRLPWGKWKLAKEFETIMEAEEFMFRKSGFPIGWLYNWQLRGYASYEINGQKTKV